MCVCVCGDGGFDPCTLVSQCATGVQPHPAPESNQFDAGQVRLLKPISVTVVLCIPIAIGFCMFGGGTDNHIVFIMTSVINYRVLVHGPCWRIHPTEFSKWS